jgi:hypothetical protein
MEINQQIKFDQEIQVTENQYKAVRKSYSGYIVHRQDEENGNFYIKVWSTKYILQIQYILDSVK